MGGATEARAGDDGVVADDRERLRGTFNDAADLYQRARPEYPVGLYEELIRWAELHPGDHLLDIGCGTGKATFPLVALDRSGTPLPQGLGDIASRRPSRLPGRDACVPRGRRSVLRQHPGDLRRDWRRTPRLTPRGRSPARCPTSGWRLKRAAGSPTSSCAISTGSWSTTLTATSSSSTRSRVTSRWCQGSAIGSPVRFADAYGNAPSIVCVVTGTRCSTLPGGATDLLSHVRLAQRHRSSSRHDHAERHVRSAGEGRRPKVHSAAEPASNILCRCRARISMASVDIGCWSPRRSSSSTCVGSGGRAHGVQLCAGSVSWLWWLRA